MRAASAWSLGRLPNTRGKTRATVHPRHLVFRASASDGSRQSWDFRRFLKTITYFNNPLENLLKFLVPTQPDSDIHTIVTGSQPISLIIIGGETDLGRCILDQISFSVPVRVLVPDAQDIRERYRSRIEESKMEFAEWNKAETLNTSLLPEASPIITIGNIPPSFVRALKEMHANEKIIYDPSSNSKGMEWGSLDDVVMGGCSESQLRIEQSEEANKKSVAVFSGNITSANNGGFASVRTRNINPALNLTGFNGLKLRIKGDGQTYKFIIRTSTDWDSIGYCQSFDTLDEWQDVTLPFDRFFPVFRAKTVSPPTPINTSEIRSLQIMLSKFEYDGKLNPNIKMGLFNLPIEAIAAYKRTQKEQPRVVCINGDEQGTQEIKVVTQNYTIISSDKLQQSRFEDSTFVQFCLACVSEKASVKATFTEKSRSQYSDAMTFEQLLENFEKSS